MDLWEPKRRIEIAFRHNLQEIAKQIIVRIGDNDDPEAVKHALRSIGRLPEFQSYAESSALKMVTHLFDDQGRTWRQAATANGKGKMMYEALQRELRGRTGQMLIRQVQRNAEIIKTLPLEISNDVTDYIAKESLKGRRASDISREIALKFPEQTKARADLIARTEVSKTQSALTESRCREFGVDWYVWRACGGSRGDNRTRDSHRGLSGVLISWNDPPAPEELFPTIGKNGKRYRNSLGSYHAGCCPNCRCYAEPVVVLDVFSWPMRIYRNGSIERINRKSFIKISNIT